MNRTRLAAARGRSAARRPFALPEALESRVLFAALPAPFQSTDIGSVGAAGSTQFANGTFTVMGAGDDAAFGATDANQFAYQTLSGDGTIVAHVNNMGGANATPLAGLVLRSSLDPSAAAVFVAERDPNVVIANSRTSNGGSGTNLVISPAGNPYWLELVRTGSTITAKDSADGTTFTTVATTTLTGLPNNVLVGMAVGSQSPGNLGTGTFDHVVVTPASAGPSATLAAAPITGGVQTGAYGFTVTYASSAGVNASSIGGGNVVVTGPGGYSQPATVTNPPGANAQSIVAHYSVNPPPTTPGTYTVTLLPNQVLDANGSAAAGQVLGTFTVSAAAAAVPSVTGTVTNAATGAGVAGQRVFFDLNQDGQFEANEPWGLTDANGNYSIGQAGNNTFRVTQELKPGQTYASPSSGFHDVTVALGSTVTNTNFTDTIASGSLPDLTAAFAGKLPTSLTAGKRAAVSVAVSNAGTAAAKGTISIALSTSATSAADPAAPALMTFANLKLNLKPKGKHVYRLAFTVPAGQAAGNRFLTATVDSANQVSESNEGNNTAVSAKAVSVG